MRRSLFVSLGTTSNIGDFLEKTVAESLRSKGFSLKANKRGCDIVAEKDGRRVIIECKMNVRRSNWFQVLNQVRRYRDELDPYATILLVGNMRVFAPFGTHVTGKGFGSYPVGPSTTNRFRS